jgi:hypothetical protein
MGFGLSTNIEVPKVEVPKVELPKIDPSAAVSGATAGIKDAAAGAIAGVAGVVSGAVDAAVKAAVALSSVAGALAEAAVSFKGGTADFAMEPHLVLDANAGYGDTEFEKGPVWIRVDLTQDQAKENTDTLHLFSDPGGYDEQKPISAFRESNGKTVDVVFEDAPMDASFTLEVIPATGLPHAIFSGVAYGDLRKTKQRI